MEAIWGAINNILAILVGVWIILVVVVWKKKITIFHDQMEPKLAQRRYRILKALLLAAGISAAVFVASIILDGTISSNLPGNDVSVFAYTAWISSGLFLIATVGSLVIFLKGRVKPT